MFYVRLLCFVFRYVVVVNVFVANLSQQKVDHIQMQDSGMQDENIQLLGEEGLRAGGQPPMKLG